MPKTALIESELDACLNSYESRLAKQGRAAVEDFLPSREHPEYEQILCELIRVALEHEWLQGHATTISGYLDKFPELQDMPDSLQAICYEEYRQRLQFGDRVLPQTYAQNFGINVDHWPSSLSTKANVHREHELEYPAIGQSFLGFQLIELLGRGTFAQVYLARQDELSQRPVALKVSRHRSLEAKRLARLQHTHIMPIYSVHQHADWDVVCMPYLGARTLADLISDLRQQHRRQENTTTAHETLDLEQLHTLPNNIGHQELTVARRQANAGQALKSACQTANEVLELFRKIAQGLQHAHERGIVHRDLKPANILLADDGTPLILDFNLAAEQQAQHQAREAFVGGTLPYMAPEQLAGFRAGHCSGDERADLFSLGVILYEILFGQPAHPRRQGTLEQVLAASWQDRQSLPQKLESQFQDCSPAVWAIVEKCLQPNPQQRYQSSIHLQEDIERHLQNHPLRHASEPSLRERLKKWSRRHPRLLSITSFIVVATLGLIAFTGAWLYQGRQVKQIQAAEAGRNVLQELQTLQGEFTRSPLSERSQLKATVAHAKDFLEHLPGQSSQALESSDLYNFSTAARQETLRAAAAEAHFLLAAGLHQQANSESNAATSRAILEQAWRHNQNAIAVARAASPAFERQAQQIRAGLGLKPITVKHSDQPLTSRDLCQQALLLGSERRFREALPYWRKATLADPQNLWTWYGLGYCCEQLDQPGRAVECYSACIALRPDYAAGFLDRGRMRILQKDFDSACEDLQQAVKLEPSYEATLNLGIAYLENESLASAIETLQQAQKLGGDKVRIQMLLARAYDKSGNKPLAAAARQAASTETPKDSDTWSARGVSLVPTDPQAALNCFTLALQANPYSWAALESAAHVLSEKLDRQPDAIAMLDLAVRLFPEKAACVANRGVLHARASHSTEALQDAETALALEPSPEIRYQVACIHSLLAKPNNQHKQTAVQHLAKVLLQGYGGHFLSTDPDLAPLADDPQFQKLRSAVQALNLQQPAD